MTHRKLLLLSILAITAAIFFAGGFFSEEVSAQGTYDCAYVGDNVCTVAVDNCDSGYKPDCEKYWGQSWACDTADDQTCILDLKGLGEACQDDDECESGNCEYDDGKGYPVCKTVSDCTTTGCDPGYDCTTDTGGTYFCEPSDCRADEISCDSGDSCQLDTGGTYTCQPDQLKDIGEACQNNGECSSGICEYDSGKGYPVCTLKGVGEACQSDDECNSGNCEYDGGKGYPVCKLAGDSTDTGGDLKGLGEACQNDGECSSGNCEYDGGKGYPVCKSAGGSTTISTGEVGDTCADWSECETQACVNEVCVEPNCDDKEYGLVPCGGPMYDDDGNIIGQCPRCEFKHLFVLIHNVVDVIIFTIGPALVAIMILVGGFMILMSKGNPGLLGKGKNIVKWAMLGYLLVLFAWVIVNTILLMFNLAEWVDMQNWWNLTV